MLIDVSIPYSMQVFCIRVSYRLICYIDVQLVSRIRNGYIYWDDGMRDLRCRTKSSGVTSKVHEAVSDRIGRHGFLKNIDINRLRKICICNFSLFI